MSGAERRAQFTLDSPNLSELYCDRAVFLLIAALDWSIDFLFEVYLKRYLV